MTIDRLALIEQEPHVFRVRPFGEDSDPFFVVCVDETIEAMRERAAACFENVAPADMIACCWSMSGEGPYEDMFGILQFARTHLGSGLVAHEMSHAAFRTLERLGIKLAHWRRVRTSDGETANGREEVYCNVVENLNREFWREAYARKLA